MLTEKEWLNSESWTSKNSYLKEVDYAAKSDMGKAKLSLVPRRIIWDIATIREYGNNKYPDGGPDNWRSVEPVRYRDAAFRHFLRYLDDPYSLDGESGLPHLWHLACNIAFLCEMEDQDFGKVPGPVITPEKKDSGKYDMLFIPSDNPYNVQVRPLTDQFSITAEGTIMQRKATADPEVKESAKRDCSNCKYGLPDASFEKCRACEDGFTNWEPKTEVEE